MFQLQGIVRRHEVLLNVSESFCRYVRVLISLWLFLFHLFLFAVEPKEFFLDGLKKLEQRSHKSVELRGEM
jgi:hypothetical protein